MHLFRFTVLNFTVTTSFWYRARVHSCQTCYATNCEVCFKWQSAGQYLVVTGEVMSKQMLPFSCHQCNTEWHTCLTVCCHWVLSCWEPPLWQVWMPNVPVKFINVSVIITTHEGFSAQKHLSAAQSSWGHVMLLWRQHKCLHFNCHFDYRTDWSDSILLLKGKAVKIIFTEHINYCKVCNRRQIEASGVGECECRIRVNTV